MIDFKIAKLLNCQTVIRHLIVQLFSRQLPTAFLPIS